jgi:hypothetical protein
MHLSRDARTPPRCSRVVTCPKTIARSLGQISRLQICKNVAMASYSVNKAAVAKARQLIDAHQYVLDSDWGEAQPTADDENSFLESHSWDDYADWHLALSDGTTENTKARYAFVFGDFRRVHRSGLIACQYRAAEWKHKQVELAAHNLLQHLDKTSA